MKYTHGISYSLFVFTSLVMIALFIVGFFLPPPGVIDPSVIQAGAELMTLAFIAQLPHIIRIIGDRAIKIKKGDFSVEAAEKEKGEEK